MRVWLPHHLYKTFPLLVGATGFLGCFSDDTAALALGGLLMLYSAGVGYMRLQHSF
ncbi:hypothetical protein SAMN04488082_10319 [Desulfomicrobium apsheronum]|jgi:hypothetical protein|uniref:Uncharacterized protein n=1 Tax=Desulfomicrobium apsheronum TaxID=52560 RepID=A0A1I3R379_9BACT|nr:hypothetical protein SAMN04488082_10319 [Desulfomicrobium apsheronum]